MAYYQPANTEKSTLETNKPGERRNPAPFQQRQIHYVCDGAELILAPLKRPDCNI